MTGTTVTGCCHIFLTSNSLISASSVIIAVVWMSMYDGCFYNVFYQTFYYIGFCDPYYEPTIVLHDLHENK